MEPKEEARHIHEAEIAIKAMRLKDLRAEAQRLTAEIDEHLKGLPEPTKRPRHLRSVE